MKNELRLIPMSEIKAEEVKWLWYPRVVASSASLASPQAARLTRSAAHPFQGKPTSLGFALSNDGSEDGADSSRVLVIAFELDPEQGFPLAWRM